MDLTLGATLVRRLGMQLPADPGQQRAQASFALLQLVAGIGAVGQALFVLATEGVALASVQYRIGLNLGLGVVILVALFGFTARGRLSAAGSLVAGGILMFDVLFAIGFSLRSTPTPSMITMCLVGAASLVEPPRRIIVWAILAAVVLGSGQLITPIWSATPATSGLLVIVFTVAFFAVVLIEFRSSMLDALDTLGHQAATLARTNADLQRTLQERDELSDRLATTRRMEAMGSMAGNIAHEFNNMLSVIRGYSDRIAAEAADAATTAPIREEIDQLVHAVSRASNVTRDVMDIATPVSFAFARMDLAQFILAQEADLRSMLAPRVELQVSVSPDSCLVSADHEQLQRVFHNLMANARDATSDGGTVHINVTRTTDRVLCVVRDEGRGVPAAQRERIFEPFYSTKGTTGGGGLGLASTYAIIRQHQGFITVDDAQGGGAEFTIDLPRVLTRATATTPRGVARIAEAAVPVVLPTAPPSRLPTPVGKPLESVSVLLVEDDVALRKLVMRMLQRAGAEVDAVDNGLDAIARLQPDGAQTMRYDVVVTDLRLPVGSGGDVIAAALASASPVALIVVSGFLDDATVARHAATDTLQFLAKPFAEAQLLDTIAVARRVAHERDALRR